MPGNPFTDPNWAPDLADTVERTVGKVRAIATDNAVKVSRGLVFGVLALISVLVAVPLVVILLLGVFRETLGFFVDHDQAVWISYLAIGGLMVLGGFLALSRRQSKQAA